MFDELDEDLDRSSLRRPICCRYESVSFARCEVAVLGTASGVLRCLSWALGFAADDQHEVVGVWPASMTGSVDYQVMLGDLGRLGLEQAGFVLSWEPEVLWPMRQLSSWGATVLPSVQHLLRTASGDASPTDRRCLAEIGWLLQGADGVAEAEAMVRELVGASTPGAFAERMQQVLEAIQALRPLVACPPRVRDAVLRCDARVQELQRALERAVRRHGAFGSEAEALAFVERSLERNLVRFRRAGTAGAGREGLKVAPRFGTVRAGTPAGA